MEWLIIAESILKMFIFIAILILLGLGVLTVMVLIISISNTKKQEAIKEKERLEQIYDGIKMWDCINTIEKDMKTDYHHDAWKKYREEKEKELIEEDEEILDDDLLVQLMEEQDDEKFYKWIDRYHKHLKRVRNRQALYIKRKAKYGK